MLVFLKSLFYISMTLEITIFVLFTRKLENAENSLIVAERNNNSYIVKSYHYDNELFIFHFLS